MDRGGGMNPVLLNESEYRQRLSMPLGYWGGLIPPPEPLGLSLLVLHAARIALGRNPKTGGCRTFYAAEEWVARKEDYGCDSKLVIVHDGGDFASLINLDYEMYELHDKFITWMQKLLPGYILEPQTCWYAALYPKDRQ